MTLVGFRGTNHPQQTRVRGARDDVDDRGTRWDEFNPISERFGGFTLDVAAAPHNAKCDNYYTIEDDGLSQPWSGRVWCNPPYSDLGAWVQKAWAELPNCETIVMLVPANRTEQKWWQEHVEPERGNGILTVEFLPGRMRFDRPTAIIGPKGDRPPFGCALLIWSRETTATNMLAEAWQEGAAAGYELALLEGPASDYVATANPYQGKGHRIVIANAEQLDELGVRATVLDNRGDIWTNDGDPKDKWGSVTAEESFGGPKWVGLSDMHLPVTVLYRPAG